MIESVRARKSNGEPRALDDHNDPDRHPSGAGDEPMTAAIGQTGFRPLNAAYNNVFRPDRLTVGLVAPIEAYPTSPAPSMHRHLERAELAEELGFAAIWLRDVPFNVPSFGDTGQILDPFVYLGLLTGATRRIALGVASIVLPLRHPAHVAKAAASVDVLSGGRLILGVASGDRPDEFPAMNTPFDQRSERFRQSFDYLRQMAQVRPVVDGPLGTLEGDIDLLPKPTAGTLPLLVTGSSRQDPDWIAGNGDGWMLYPRPAAAQAGIIRDWRARVASTDQPAKPILQPLYVDLVDDAQATPEPIHLGFRSGVEYLRSHLVSLREIGVNHVALNLRFNTAPVESTLRRLAEEILPDFTCEEQQP